jgi:hypothetical protein
MYRKRYRVASAAAGFLDAQVPLPKSNEGARGKSFPPHFFSFLSRLGLDQRLYRQLAVLDFDVGGFAFLETAFEDEGG